MQTYRSVGRNAYIDRSNHKNMWVLLALLAMALLIYGVYMASRTSTISAVQPNTTAYGTSGSAGMNTTNNANSGTLPTMGQ